MIEVILETIQSSLVSTHRIIVLKERGSERYLPIWIGPFEAEAISVAVNHKEMPRPLTHDLLVSLVGRLGAELQYVYINEIHDKLFHARIVLDLNGKELELDSRTSDAVAVAVRADIPIYVKQAVMDSAAVIPEAEIAESDGQNLNVFRNFLNQLDTGESGQDN